MMSSIPPKPEGRRRPVSVLSLKVWELADQLEERLDNPGEVLEMLVTLLAKGEAATEVWSKLHTAAARFDKTSDLAFAYEQVTHDKRIKLLSPDHQAFIFLQVAQFFADVFQDSEGATGYAERAVAAEPGHAEAFTLLETLLAGNGRLARLAELYAEASDRESAPEKRIELLYRAFRIALSIDVPTEFVIDLGNRILKLAPADGAVRDEVMRRLIVSGQHRDVIELLESALRREPPPPPEEAMLHREQLVDLCFSVLNNPERALTHLEGLLHLDPGHEMAQKAAVELLSNPQLMLRAAAALSDASEKMGDQQRAIEMLGLELEHVRGPRRVEVQRRLAILRQDALGDREGALELLGPVVAGDPGDDALRERFVALNLALNQPEQAARLLSRAQATHRDAGVRARVALDVGHVYLFSQDVRRAQAAFEKVLETNADEGASLAAAKKLAELHTASGDTAELAKVLEIIVELEEEREGRQVAARKLVQLSDDGGVVPDRRRASLGYRALVGSPWTEEALEKLERFYTDAGDDLGLADVFSFRAERSENKDDARALGARALELRTGAAVDAATKVEAYQRFIATFGPSRDVTARLAPLLDELGRHAELDELLLAEIEQAPSDEQVGLWFRVAELRRAKLGNDDGALDALTWAIALDPEHAPTREALERMLRKPETRLRAAAILEPLYRRQRANSGLFRVLEVRVAAEPDMLARLTAAEEAVRVAEDSVNAKEAALKVAADALNDAVAHAPERIPDWLPRIETLAAATGNVAERARILAGALGERAVDSAPLFALARSLGDAYSAVGDASNAIQSYRRALAFDPNSGAVIDAIDALLAQQGAPEERLALYETALADETDPGRRRDFLRLMAKLQRFELKDRAGAVTTLRRALAFDPTDWAAHEALVDVLSESGDHVTAARELEQALPSLAGERRSVALLRLAEAEERASDRASALGRYRELLEVTELSPETLANVERLAREQNDGGALTRALWKQFTATSDERERADVLERLGDAYKEQLGDPVAASGHWLNGARIAHAQGDEARARRLYERVLEAVPENVEAAERVVELAARNGDFARVSDAFGAVLAGASEDRLVPIIGALEGPALEHGAASKFAEIVDRALARDLAPPRAFQLAFTKARVLASVPEGREAARSLFRSLLVLPDADTELVLNAFSDLIGASEPSPARAEDMRYLYAFQLERAPDPLPLLFGWARAEENELGDPKAAIALYERIAERYPSEFESYFELARLRAETGDDAGALGALAVLRERAGADDRLIAELATAEILLERMGRGAEALALVAPILQAEPRQRDALRIVQRGLSIPETRAEAAELLERAAEAFTDPAGKADVIEALLAVSADSPELADARRRWMQQLLSARGDEPLAALALALRAAEAAPGEREAWQHAEQTARKLSKPEPVAEAYARVFERPLRPELADELGRAMIEFYEEWFDDPDRVVALLERVLALCPSATWAFDRLKLAFNAGGRWPELFALYDMRLGSDLDSPARIELLREAAMAARDFANDAERGMAYLEALNRESPGDGRVEASLERLYERHARKRPLIALLTARLGGLPEAERADLKNRIAALWLDLGEPEPALDLAEELFELPSHVEVAVQLMERALTLPASADAPADPTRERPLTRATAKLKAHYSANSSVADVARVLGIEERNAATPAERRALLEQIVRLRLRELRDVAGAFETMAELVLLDPESPGYRKNLADLGKRIGAEERRAEVLVAAARLPTRVSVKSGLLNEAASVYRHALANDARAIELYREVLREADVPAPVALAAARELALLLRAEGDPIERAAVLERLAGIEDDPSLRRAALGEAAEIALERLSDPARAILSYRKRIADDAADLEAMHGLCRALEASRAWDELIAALEARAAIQQPDAARADRVRVAELYATEKADRPTAIEAWRRVVELHGGDPQSFQALSGLLTAEDRFPELAELLANEIATTDDRDRRRELLLELGALHEERTLDRMKALEAFVAAGDWPAAVRVTSSTASDRATGRKISERLLELSIAGWQSEGGGPESPPALAVDFSLDDLCRRLAEEGEYEEVVRRLLAGASLPLPVRRRRELVREAGCLASDRLGDSERAIQLFQSLLEEDGADEIAISCVTRLALLLEEKGRFDVIATLWENQAQARAQAGDAGAAQSLWARAGEISEERLGDLDRALRDYERGAEIGGEDCLEALARVFKAQGRMDQVARALERLSALSTAEALPERALRLADAYLSLGRRTRAREALEQALTRVSDGASLRQKLAVIYREAEDHGALAALFEDEAGRAENKAQALALLKDAADLHLDKRRQPAAAVPLLERAIALEPEDSALRLRLAQALYSAERFEPAAAVLREQVGRYGARRPKDRALVHYELARVLLSANDRGGALEELDAAARIDPAHPKILHMLARTAFEQGELDRAERMYRALLLVAPKEDDADAPSRSEALVALGEIARDRGDEGRYDEFVSTAFEAAQESKREARTLEAALRKGGRADLVARILEVRLAQGLPAKEAARCLADLCELHDRVLGTFAAARGSLLARARVLEEELARRESTDDEAWSGLGRTYAALGEPAAEARILERRVDASARSSRPPPGPDLYFRLAQVRLGEPKTLEQGLDLLERALELGLPPESAESLLKTAFPEGQEPARVLDLFEKGARANDDRRSLLKVIARRVALGDGGVEQVREGVTLAQELGEPALGDQLLAVAIATATAGSSPADAAWLRLELAKRHRQAGDVPAALALEEEAAEYVPPAEGRSLLFTVAREALALGDAERAARLLALLRRDDPENPEIYGPLIDLYRSSGQVEKLVDLLEETTPLVTSTEERTRLRLEQAELLLNPLDRKNEALLLLREIVRDDPKERRAHARLFELLDAEGREDELIELFDAEIDAQRERGDYEAAAQLTLRLIGWLERHGRVREAIQACRAGLEQSANRREMLDTLLRLSEASGDPDLVADAIERILETERGPRASELCRRLIAIREKATDSIGIERALELGFAASPGDVELCDRLASLYTRWGDLARVVSVYERALAARPRDPTLLERQVEAYRAAGRHEQALGALETLSEVRPDDAFARRARAALLGELGRHTDAVLELERAAQNDSALLPELVAGLDHALIHAAPEDKPLLGRKLVDALELSGDAAAARARLVELVEAAPDSQELLLRLGELEANAGNDEAAIGIFSRLVELVEGPAVVAPALALAGLTERAGQPARARGALERALEADRSNADVRSRLIAVLEADGAYRALAGLLREEAEAEPRRDERAKKLMRVGELLLLPDGDVEEALRVLESVRAELKDSLEVVVLLGRAYTYAGQNDKALEILDACIEANRGKRVRALGAVYEQKADVHLDEGFLTDGLGALGKAFEMDPKNARLGMRLAQIALESEENETAQRALRAVAIMKTAPVDGPEGARSDTKADANFTLAEMAQRAGDPRKARVLAAKALSENPDHEKARALLKVLDAR